MGNVLNNPIYAAFWGCTFYRNILNRHTYVLDGKRDFEVTLYMSNELEIIENIWKKTSFSLFDSVASKVRLWVICKLICSYYMKHLFGIGNVQLIKESNRCLGVFLSTLQLVDKAILKGFHYLSRYSLLLESTSFIALSYLGFYPTAIAGLSSLALSELKKRGLINQKIDRVLSLFTVCINTLFTWNFTMQMRSLGVVFKSIVYFGMLSDFIDFVANHLRIDLVSSAGRYFQQTPPKERSMLSMVEFDKEKFLSKDAYARDTLKYPFKIEENYRLEEFPLVEEVDESRCEKLVEDRLEKEEIFFEESAYKGYHNLRNCLKNGAVLDGTVPDSTLLRKKIAMSFSHLIKMADSDNFKASFLDLCEKGISCSSGWINELTYFSQPEFTSVREYVLYQLAIFRDEIVKEACLQVCTNKDQACNAHVIQNVAERMLFWFPTYEGVFAYKQHFSLICKVMNSTLKKLDKVFFPKMRELSVFPLIDGVITLEKDFITNFLTTLVESEKDRISLYLSSKITPQKRGEVVHREIPWDCITKWMNSHPDIAFYHEDEGWDPFWVETVVVDGKELPTLTENGVQLLLWDLGVLKFPS